MEKLLPIRLTVTHFIHATFNHFRSGRELHRLRGHPLVPRPRAARGRHAVRAKGRRLGHWMRLRRTGQCKGILLVTFKAFFGVGNPIPKKVLNAKSVPSIWDMS